MAGTYAFNIGFFMILVMTEIASIPVESSRRPRSTAPSACNGRCYIILPLLRHVIGTCILLSLLIIARVLRHRLHPHERRPNNATLSLTVYAFQQYTAEQWGYANTVGVFIVVTGFVVIVAIRRLFRIGERET